jgi:hypothetical protein
MSAHSSDGIFFANIYRNRELWLQSRELDRVKRHFETLEEGNRLE